MRVLKIFVFFALAALLVVVLKRADIKEDLAKSIGATIVNVGREVANQMFPPRK